MNKVIDKGFRRCRFISTIVKHPVLQGKGRKVLHMLEEVLAFERNLTALARDLQKGTLSHFPNLKEFKEAHMVNSEYLHSAVIAIQTSFGKRFCEFREEKKHYPSLSLP